jgi:hypothetical protein
MINEVSIHELTTAHLADNLSQLITANKSELCTGTF